MIDRSSARLSPAAYLLLPSARRLALVAAAGLMLVSLTIQAPYVNAQPQDERPETPEQDTDELLHFRGPAYQIDQFLLEYARQHPELPTLEELREVEIELGQIHQGYTDPRGGLPTVTRTLEQFNERGLELYDAAALQVILETVHGAMQDRGYEGVFAAPDPLQIDAQGRDLRPDDQQGLTITIFVGQVAELRTVAAGERFEGVDDPINLPAHDFIRQQSPFQPYDPPVELDQPRGDLLDAREEEEYARRMSRHPGRRVDTIRSPGEEPSTTYVDYLITENKPWAVYAQASNTGTAGTSRWRQEFGFFHNQLSGNDDILSLQYTTANFDDLHAVQASYDIPLDRGRFFRFKPSGRYQEFTATDVGVGDLEFTGRSWQAAAEVSANVFQHHALFVDLFAGARYWSVEVERDVFQDGREQFLLPRVGARLEQDTGWYSNRVSAEVEFQVGDVTGVDQDELDEIGPGSDPDRDWVVLKGASQHSIFLEPLIFGELGRTPRWDEISTLAHELALRLHGQYAFDNHLIPQTQQVAGGLRTVRGYREAVSRGDNAIIGSLEYRFYLPRVFGVDEEPREIFGEPFRVRPQYAHGPTDWDLTLRTFLDFAYLHRNSTVWDDTLLSTGVGLDLAIRRNARLGLDWGIALSDTEDQRNERGSNRLHAVFTVLY